MNKDAAAIAEVRDYNETEDKPFIMATMLQGLYYGDGEGWKMFSQIDKQIFMYNYKRILEALIAHPNTAVKVACLKEDPSVILGYSILSNDFSTIHWVHIKKAWRRNGIARALLPQRPAFCTHLSNQGKILLPKFEHCVYDPFKIG